MSYPPTPSPQAYYDQQAKDGYIDGLRSWLADEGYAVVPAEDIEELRAHVEFGLGHNGQMALQRIDAVLRSEPWQ